MIELISSVRAILVSQCAWSARLRRSAGSLQLTTLVTSTKFTTSSLRFQCGYGQSTALTNSACLPMALEGITEESCQCLKRTIYIAAWDITHKRTYLLANCRPQNVQAKSDFGSMPTSHVDGSSGSGTCGNNLGDVVCAEVHREVPRCDGTCTMRGLRTLFRTPHLHHTIGHHEKTTSSIYTLVRSSVD
jgi:hypothetical protein